MCKKWQCNKKRVFLANAFKIHTYRHISVIHLHKVNGPPPGPLALVWLWRSLVQINASGCIIPEVCEGCLAAVLAVIMLW